MLNLLEAGLGGFLSPSLSSLKAIPYIPSVEDDNLALGNVIE